MDSKHTVADFIAEQDHHLAEVDKKIRHINSQVTNATATIAAVRAAVKAAENERSAARRLYDLSVDRGDRAGIDKALGAIQVAVANSAALKIELEGSPGLADVAALQRQVITGLRAQMPEIEKAVEALRELQTRFSGKINQLSHLLPAIAAAEQSLN